MLSLRHPVGIALLAAVAAGLTLAPVTAAAEVTWLKMTGEWLDQDALVEAHRLRVAEVGEKWERGWRGEREHMLWPDDATMRKSTVLATRTKEARRTCVAELKRALKPEFVPGELVDHLVGLSGYGRSKSDFLFGRYRAGDWNIQIIYSGHRIGILALRLGPVAPREPSADYALEVAKELFVPPRPQDEAALKARAGLNSGIAHGGINNPNTQSRADPLRGPGPWYAAGFITNGQYVFLGPSKWHLGDGDIRSDLAGLPRAPRADEPVLLFD